MNQRNECVQCLWDSPSTVLICSVPKTPHRCVESAVQPKVVALYGISVRVSWSLIPAQKLYNHLKPPAPRDRKGWKGLSSTMCAGKLTARQNGHTCARKMYFQVTTPLTLSCVALEATQGGVVGEYSFLNKLPFRFYCTHWFHPCTHCLLYSFLCIQSI